MRRALASTSRALRKLRNFGSWLVFGRRRRRDGSNDPVAQTEHRRSELPKRAHRGGRREDRERVLEGGLLPEGYEGEAEQSEERHQGLGDAASRYAEHFRMVPTPGFPREISG